jgi:hypothetical protein
MPSVDLRDSSGHADAEEGVGMPESESAASTTPDLSVFVAHRSEDQDDINRVVEALRAYCNNRVDFLFARDIPSGTNWRDWIKSNIAGANQFWLFYTDPDARWGWPLYEAGIFTGVVEGVGDVTRLICFHCENDEIPDALADFQAVEFTDEGIRSFLTEFFEAPSPPSGRPINSMLMKNEDMVQSLLRKFMDVVRDRESPPYRLYNKYLDLEFDFTASPEVDDIRAGKISSESNLDDIFGLYRPPETWADLIDPLLESCAADEGLSRMYQLWIDELHTGLCRASQNRVFKQPHTVFVGIDDPSKTFLPVLHGMSMKPGRTEGVTSASARIIFIKRDAAE